MRQHLHLPVKIACLLLLVVTICRGQSQNGYYGKYIGKLKSLHHGVTGEVYAVDARTFHIRDFSYDGEGPAAFFYAGTSKSPSPGGFKINDEKGSNDALGRYRKKHITLTLPESKTINSIKWLSVWCDEFSVNFGDVKIPKNLDHPKPQKLDSLSGIHGVSSENIVVVDAQTLLIPGFSYDGEAPDAKFWAGRGNKPTSQGWRIPDENGKEQPLRRYDRKTIVLTLPGDLTVFDIGHFGVWCEAFAVDFGHVRVPGNTLNVPPSLKMLGVAPQKKLRTLEQSQTLQQPVFNQQQQQRRQEGGAFLQRLRATTFRPNLQTRRLTHNKDQSSVQIVQSVGLNADPSALQHQQRQQQQQQQQAFNNFQNSRNAQHFAAQSRQSEVFNEPPQGPQNHFGGLEGQASFPDIVRTNPRRPAPGSGSFSRLAITGSSGTSNTFVRY